MYPFCQEMLNQLNDNRMYYFNRIPESPRCSISDSPDNEDRNAILAANEKRKVLRPKTDDCSDLSSIEEADELTNPPESWEPRALHVFWSRDPVTCLVTCYVWISHQYKDTGVWI